VVTNVTIRFARHDDIEQLVEMRRDFTFEDFDAHAAITRPEYEDDCRAFLAEAISSGRWHIWVAEAGERIVSHAFLALVDKVPRPIRENVHIAYLTNVYTRPDFRGRGIGAEIIQRAQAAAREANVELIIVWRRGGWSVAPSKERGSSRLGAAPRSTLDPRKGLC
jgi:GNAT superfamily N-acetyltransferase